MDGKGPDEPAWWPAKQLTMTSNSAEIRVRYMGSNGATEESFTDPTEALDFKEEKEAETGETATTYLTRADDD